MLHHYREAQTSTFPELNGIVRSHNVSRHIRSAAIISRPIAGIYAIGRRTPSRRRLRSIDWWYIFRHADVILFRWLPLLADDTIFCQYWYISGLLPPPPPRFFASFFRLFRYFFFLRLYRMPSSFLPSAYAACLRRAELSAPVCASPQRACAYAMLRIWLADSRQCSDRRRDTSQCQTECHQYYCIGITTDVECLSSYADITAICCYVGYRQIRRLAYARHSVRESRRAANANIIGVDWNKSLSVNTRRQTHWREEN